MKVAWLCPYPLARLKALEGKFRQRPEHPSTWIVTLADALVRSQPDLELHIVTESTLVGGDVEAEQDGIHFHVLRSPSCIPFARRGWPTFLPLDAWRGLSSNVWNLRRAVDQIRPDLAHGHGTERAYGLAAVRSGLPSIVSIQGIMNEIYKEAPGRMWAILRELERRCVAEGRYFIAKTAFARGFVKSLNASAEIFELPNPVHQAFLNVVRAREPGRRALFVGSLVPEKGLDELLEAAGRVPALELRVIGTGAPSYIASLHRRSQGLNIAWLGSVAVESVAQEMAQSDVLVLPSHMETSPNVVAEAMCAGLPVIATNVGGIPSMVEHGRTGWLVHARDANGLRDAIQDVLGNTPRAQAIATAAREFARARYRGDAIAGRVAEAYGRIHAVARGAAR